MPSRIIFHPIVQNRRSRVIFFIFLATAAAVGAACWLYVDSVIKGAGVVIDRSTAPLLISNRFRVGLILAITLIGTAFTAWQVVGPTLRIEQWLRDWNDKINPFPLLVRKNDKFSHLAELLNRLYRKINGPSQT